MPKPLTIAGRRFPSQLAAIAYVRKILNAGPPGSEVVGEDRDIVEALLAARGDKLLDLQGLNVVRYLRNWQPKRPGENDWTLCFWAELEDGTLVDFSYMKAIRILGDEGQRALCA